MGKVVRSVVTVGIGIVALALAAPTGGLSVAGFFGLTGAGAALVGTLAAAAFSAAATLGLKAIGLTTGPPGWTKIIGFSPGALPPISEMRPRHSHWIKRLLTLSEWTRFDVEHYSGDCMPQFGRKGWVLFDRKAIIRRGDAFAFNTRGPWGIVWRLSHVGALKRFVGCDPVAGTFEFEMDYPPTMFSARLEDIKFAYRVRWQGASLLGALRAWRDIVRNPSAHDERLAG